MDWTGVAAIAISAVSAFFAWRADQRSARAEKKANRIPDVSWSLDAEPVLNGIRLSVTNNGPGTVYFPRVDPASLTYVAVVAGLPGPVGELLQGQPLTFTVEDRKETRIPSSLKVAWYPEPSAPEPERRVGAVSTGPWRRCSKAAQRDSAVRRRDSETDN